MPVDELSRATIESLKQTLCKHTDYKRFEPILDWGFAMADNQFISALKELVNTDLASELDSPENANAALNELREGLAALTSSGPQTVEVSEATAPKMSWRQLARCNSDSMAENAELAKSALAQEREDGPESKVLSIC